MQEPSKEETPRVPAAVPVQRRLVAFDPNTGLPVVQTTPMLTKAQVSDIAMAAVSQPYHDPLGLEPEFEGLTNMEVMMIRLARCAAQTGDRDDINVFLNRILGSPVAKSESKNLNVTTDYEAYLSSLATVVSEPPIPAEVVTEDIFS